MKNIKRIIALAILAALMTGGFGGAKAGAKPIPYPEVPKISISASKDKLKVTLKIEKTKNAKGYIVYCKGMADMYKMKSTTLGERDQIKLTTVEESGDAVRTVDLTALLPKGKYEIAVCSYNVIEGSRLYSNDCEEKTAKIPKNPNKTIGYKKKYDFSGLKEGDIFKFGAYEQDNNLLNGNEPIEWIVLSCTDDQIFALSRYILDNLSFGWCCPWKDSVLKKWLNGGFYGEAFNAVEKKMINATILPEYNENGTTMGSVTSKNKVFLLSYEEALDHKYLISKVTDIYGDGRRCTGTDYANLWGLVESKHRTLEGKPSSDWRLRSGYGQDIVEPSGFVVFKDYDHSSVKAEEEYGVRPAIYINIK